MCQIVLHIHRHLLPRSWVFFLQVFGYAMCVASVVAYAAHSVIYKKYLHLLEDNTEVEDDSNIKVGKAF